MNRYVTSVFPVRNAFNRWGSAFARALCCHGIFAAALGLYLLPCAATADPRLLGDWKPINAPFQVPEGSSLTITQAGSVFAAHPTTAFTVPLPTNCAVTPEQRLAAFTPLTKARFQLDFWAPQSGSCALVQQDSLQVELTFIEDGSSFIACQSNARCTSWLRIGKAPDPISTKTVPTTPIVAATKATVAVAWETLVGVTSYTIKLQGPVLLTKTVKRGNAVKFTKVPNGTYRVTLTGSFKDKKGVVRKTRATKAVKVTVKVTTRKKPARRR